MAEPAVSGKPKQLLQLIVSMVETLFEVIEDSIRIDQKANDTARRLKLDPVNHCDGSLAVRFEEVLVDPVAERSLDLLFGERTWFVELRNLVSGLASDSEGLHFELHSGAE